MLWRKDARRVFAYHLRMDAIDPKRSVAEIMAQHPQTLLVFLAWRLDCIGCDLAPFCTFEDVAADYHIDLGAFLTDLNQVLQREERE